MRSLLRLRRNPKWPRRARRTLRRRPPKRAPRRNVLSLTADEGALFREQAWEQKGPALVVGLGNPGIEYQFTPHNAGFLAIDRLAEQGGACVAHRPRRAVAAPPRVAGR